MKLFNLSAVALLSTLPMSAAIDKGEQRWEIELNSAEEHLEQVVNSFALQYHEYSTGVFNQNDFTNAFEQEHLELKDYYDLNFKDEADPVEAIKDDFITKMASKQSIDLDKMTIIHSGTSLERDRYEISKNDEKAILSIEFPLSEIDTISVQSTILHNVEGYSIGERYGDPLISVFGADSVNPVNFAAEYASGLIGRDASHRTYSLEVLFNVNSNYWTLSEIDVDFWESEQEFKDDGDTEHVNEAWNAYKYEDLGIVPVKGSSILGWLLFIIPMSALAGPLVAKKITDHKIKSLVKKGGA